jgi:hypothetical protein
MRYEIEFNGSTPSLRKVIFKRCTSNFVIGFIAITIHSVFYSNFFRATGQEEMFPLTPDLLVVVFLWVIIDAIFKIRKCLHLAANGVLTIGTVTSIKAVPFDSIRVICSFLVNDRSYTCTGKMPDSRDPELMLDDEIQILYDRVSPKKALILLELAGAKLEAPSESASKELPSSMPGN